MIREAPLASPTPSQPSVAPSQELGLAHWMQRVLTEWENVRADFSPDPVHDLRVALRRCRSIADGLMSIDPDPTWKQMKRAGKKLFSALGDLRDSHVMTEWIDKLSTPDDPVGKSLAAYSASREQDLQREAKSALESFDRKRWTVWCEVLPKRAAKIPPGSLVFQHMALERWTEAYGLHRRALRNRSAVSYHRLRIGLKRLRYTVENFLPQLHELWIDDLKHLQDMLGEIHDLDVLWETAVRIGAFPDAEARRRWQTKIRQERQERIEKYRKMMVGPKSLWPTWRAQLPAGEEVQKGALTRLKLWASYLDPDFTHSRRVTRFALQLYDGLFQNGLLRRDHHQDLRPVLEVAALLHDVGRSKGAKKHHKAGARMLGKLDPPLGYSAGDLRLASVVARYHRGGLPRETQKSFSKLTTAQKKRVMLLSGILRLADALDRGHQGVVKKVAVSRNGDHIVVAAAGYNPHGPLAERIAAARHLLEVVYGCPVMMCPMDGQGTGQAVGSGRRTRKWGGRPRPPGGSAAARRIHSKTSGSNSEKKA